MHDFTTESQSFTHILPPLWSFPVYIDPILKIDQHQEEEGTTWIDLLWFNQFCLSWPESHATHPYIGGGLLLSSIKVCAWNNPTTGHCPSLLSRSIEDVQYKLKNEIKLNSSLSHNKIFEHINECQFKRPEKRPRKESFVLCFLMNVINLIIKRVSTWVPSSSMTINK